MTNRPPRPMSKWIFVVIDLLLLAGCAWTLREFLAHKSPYAGLVAVAAIVAWMYGAWICILPWVEEYRAETRLMENEKLADAVAQIQKLEEIGARIQTATGSWQSAQDAAARTAALVREAQEKMKAEMKSFVEFTERVNSEEKKHLQLEIEKLRRTEGDWLQVTARMLDHTFALAQAAQRSGQPGLIAQLANFQNACRDSVRRMGLIPFHPGVGDIFDTRAHQLETEKEEPSEGAVITEVLATGFTYQGQLLRRALVRTGLPEREEMPAPPAEEQASVAEPAAEPASDTGSGSEGESEVVAETEPKHAEPQPPEPEVEPEVTPEGEPAAEPEKAEGREETAVPEEPPVERVEGNPEDELPRRLRRGPKPDLQASLPL